MTFENRKGRWSEGSLIARDLLRGEVLRVRGPTGAKFSPSVRWAPSQITPKIQDCDHFATYGVDHNSFTFYCCKIPIT